MQTGMHMPRDPTSYIRGIDSKSFEWFQTCSADEFQTYMHNHDLNQKVKNHVPILFVLIL